LLQLNAQGWLKVLVTSPHITAKAEVSFLESSEQFTCFLAACSNVTPVDVYQISLEPKVAELALEDAGYTDGVEAHRTMPRVNITVDFIRVFGITVFGKPHTASCRHASSFAQHFAAADAAFQVQETRSIQDCGPDSAVVW
jgi:hypothetical protein